MNARDITINAATDARVWLETLDVADGYRFAPHDGAYLEPAERRSLLSATPDAALMAAGTMAGVPTWRISADGATAGPSDGTDPAAAIMSVP